jgi:decaprenylphospho-beta-D-erythro-pentofuranosid-2-ulose 2-reductase
MMQRWIIVGATGGLGSAIARELAAIGCELSLVSSPDSRGILEENARDLEIRSGHPVQIATLDATNPDGFTSVLDELTEHGEPFGLIWSAGVLWDQVELQRDPERVRTYHQINFTSASEFLELVAARMEAVGVGHIVALGSPAGDRGRKSNYLYGASKAALHTQMEGMHHRFAGTSINVTTIKPGPTRTPMTAGLKQPLQVDVKPQAVRIVQAIERGKAVVYTPPVWWPIMHAIRHLPRFIFDKLDL